MKKVLIALGILAALSVVVTGALALYVYTRDFGVDYKGRARLDYNWKYYFAACSKEEYKFDGKLFSFSYPKLKGISPIDAIDNSNPGIIGYGPQFLEITWHLNEPASIKSELSSHLSYNGTDLPVFSKDFIDWVLCETEKGYLDSDRVYDTHSEKINFRSGGSAILLSLHSKTEHRPHMKYLVGITPSGDVFKVKNMVRYNFSEAAYREAVFHSDKFYMQHPNPARDAQSACVLNRFLASFEYKKQPGKR